MKYKSLILVAVVILSLATGGFSQELQELTSQEKELVRQALSEKFEKLDLKEMGFISVGGASLDQIQAYLPSQITLSEETIHQGLIVALVIYGEEIDYSYPLFVASIEAEEEEIDYGAALFDSSGEIMAVSLAQIEKLEKPVEEPSLSLAKVEEKPDLVSLTLKTGAYVLKCKIPASIKG